MAFRDYLPKFARAFFFPDAPFNPEAFAGPYDTESDPADLKIEREKGVSGTLVAGSDIEPNPGEYNPDWVGAAGIENAEKMRRSDGSVRGCTLAIKLPIMRAEFKITVNDEEKADDKDREIAKFCHDHIIGETRRHEPWLEILHHVLLMLDYGCSGFEKVWTTDDEGFYVLARLAPRLPQTYKRIRVNSDGTLKALYQEVGGKSLKMDGAYVLLFSYDKEGDNYWGIPILRYLWQHYFYKTHFYRIDAIRLDRYGVGIPKATIKENYNVKPEEKREVIKILKGLRSQEQAYIMTPEQIDITIMTPDNEHGGAAGLLESCDHHDVMMSRAVLALFLTAGNQKHGNYGTTTEWADLFLFALQSLATLICQTFDRNLVREMCDYNFDMTGREYPKMVASSLDNTSLKELAAALYNLVLGQVITPDDTLEAFFRKMFGWPKAEAENTRKAREARGEQHFIPGTPKDAAPNIKKGEPTPGTVPGSTPQPGPIRVPGDRG